VAADGDRRAINAVKEGRSEERPKFGRKRPMRAAMVAKTAATRIYNVTYPTEKSTKKEKQAAKKLVKIQFNGLKIACLAAYCSNTTAFKSKVTDKPLSR
jgi:hypothetical protein